MKRHIPLACALIAGLPLVALANLPIFKIADFNTPAPDGGTFTSFGAPVAVERQVAGEVPSVFAFQATTSNGVSGIYYRSFDDLAHGGGLIQQGVVADTSMAAFTGGNYASFSNLSGGGNELGYIATDSNGNQGVYVYGQGFGGPLLMATPQTLTPKGVPFGAFHSISVMSPSDGYPGGEISSDAGINDFQEFPDFPGGPFVFVADTNTTPPGASGPFTSFGAVSFKDPDLGSLYPGFNSILRAVHATAGGVEGIYYGADTNSGGVPQTTASLVNLASAGTATPNGAGTFTSFGGPVATSNEIAFTAHYDVAGADHQGIFAFGPYEEAGMPPDGIENPTIGQLAVTGDIAPDSGGATFIGFSDLTDESHFEIFLASLSDGKIGIYVCSNDSGSVGFPHAAQLTRVLESGDILDGKIVANIKLSPEASGYGSYDDSDVPGFPPHLEFGDVAVDVAFTDGTQGL